MEAWHTMRCSRSPVHVTNVTPWRPPVLCPSSGTQLCDTSQYDALCTECGKHVTAIDTVARQRSPPYQNSSAFVGLPADVE